MKLGDLRMNRIIVLAVLVLSSFEGVSQGHSIENHYAITSVAIRQLRQIRSQGVSIDGNQGESGEWGILCGSIERELLVGTVEEDGRANKIQTVMRFYRPNRDNGEFEQLRFMFHFLPALQASSSWDSPSIRADCDADQWGFDSGRSCTYKSSVPGARPTTMENSYAWTHEDVDAGGLDERAWNKLGHVIHLIQDMTSPAHTRGDPHPFGELESGQREIPPISLSALTLLQLDDPVELLREAREFVAHNFFSDDTIRDGQPGPRIIREGSEYLYGECLKRDDRCVASVGRKLARKTGRAFLWMARGPFIDTVIADEQFKQLAPLAVRYTASVIQRFRRLGTSIPCAAE